MRNMSLQQLAETVNGQHVGANVSFNSVSTDTRSIKQGDLFVALQGENFDANLFVKQAHENGAVAAVVSADVDVEMPYVKVNDTLHALTNMAKEQRELSGVPLIAITGSNGKTSVKEMLASIFRVSKNVLATEGNLNNQIGVPLTLLKLNERHDIAVIEMGASQSGDIAHLCDIAKPTVAILNNVGAAHLAGFGDIQGVANEKGNIISGLVGNGVAILNKEEPWFDQWLEQAGNRQVISFGWTNVADVWASSDAVEMTLENGQFTTDFVLNHHKDNIDVSLNLMGRHNVLNALAAAAAAISSGFSLLDIKQGLADVRAIKGRMQAMSGLNDSVVINDCYNANPKSFEAAMACLESIEQPVWLALGDFAELGPQSERIHQRMGEQIAMSKVQRIYAVGAGMKLMVDSFNSTLQSADKKAQHFENKQALADCLSADISVDVVVLVKGSRSQGLEYVVDKMTNKEGATCC